MNKMNIAIVSPFNPSFVSYLFNEKNIPNIHGNATAVNILVSALIELGHNVYVYTTINECTGSSLIYGRNIKVNIISKEFHPK